MTDQRGGSDRQKRLRPDTVALLGALLVIVLLVTALGSGLPRSTPLANDALAASGQETAAGTKTATVTTTATANAAATAPATATSTVVQVRSSRDAIVANGVAAPLLSEPVAMSTPTTVPTASPTAVPTSTPPATAEPTATADLVAGQAAVTETGPLPTPQGAYSWTLPVPILMYHYVSIPPPGSDIYRRDLSVSPTDFRAQMQYLVDNGYTTVTLEDLSLAITAKRELPSRPVIITLDDGYRDNYEHAFPILRELGLTATIFVATDFVDRGDPNYLSWPMIAEMDAAGIRFEPHSKSHADLSGQTREVLLYEIKGSQETLAALLGRQPRYFAYPGGRYDAATIAVLEELGYWGAVTTAYDLWHGFEERFEWGRIRMRNSTTLAEFAELVGRR